MDGKRATVPLSLLVPGAAGCKETRAWDEHKDTHEWLFGVAEEEEDEHDDNGTLIASKKFNTRPRIAVLGQEEPFTVKEMLGHFEAGETYFVLPERRMVQMQFRHMDTRSEWAGTKMGRRSFMLNLRWTNLLIKRFPL